MSIHYLIVGAIRKAYEVNPVKHVSEITNMTDDELIRMMFSNLRGGNEDSKHGLRLSQGGLAIMTSFFKKFEVVFPDQQTFSSRHVLYLDRHCSMPWHANNYLPITVTFFEADLAMRAKLVGDLDILLDAFSG
jgi:hypothetical protein